MSNLYYWKIAKKEKERKIKKNRISQLNNQVHQSWMILRNNSWSSDE